MTDPGRHLADDATPKVPGRRWENVLSARFIWNRLPGRIKRVVVAVALLSAVLITVIYGWNSLLAWILSVVAIVSALAVGRYVSDWWLKTDARRSRGAYYACGALMACSALCCWGVSLLLSESATGFSIDSLARTTVTLLGHQATGDTEASVAAAEWHGTATAYRKTATTLQLYTNAHCLALVGLAENREGANRPILVRDYSLSVWFPSGQIRAVQRMAIAPFAMDLACIEVSSAGLTEGQDFILIPEPSAQTLPLKVADDVIAVGSPLDPELQGTHTFGKISALRQIEKTLWIQHDASIDPGNSGGPLFLKRGEQVTWIGINTLKGGTSVGLATASQHAIKAHYRWGDANPAGAAKLLQEIYHVHAVNHMVALAPAPATAPHWQPFVSHLPSGSNNQKSSAPVRLSPSIPQQSWSTTNGGKVFRLIVIIVALVLGGEVKGHRSRHPRKSVGQLT